VKHSTLKWFTLVSGLALVLFLGGCAKKEVPPPPPPPPPPAPTASLTANPDSIQQGQSTTLTWRTENATDVEITTLGKVDANGSQSVTPGESTTYTLTATGPGGSQQATARVTVTVPPPPPPPPSVTDEQLFNQTMRDAFFDFDKYNVRDDARAALQADAEFLKQHPNITFTIEGHCDERGSIEYNQALGDNRARSALDFLVQAGISPDRMRTVSYGKEKPFCTEHTEECWQQNRRAHFVYGK
jgi:peptidoglycan-associated lipoprotein